MQTNRQSLLRQVLFRIVIEQRLHQYVLALTNACCSSSFFEDTTLCFCVYVSLSLCLSVRCQPYLKNQ